MEEPPVQASLANPQGKTISLFAITLVGVTFGGVTSLLSLGSIRHFTGLSLESAFYLSFPAFSLVLFLILYLNPRCLFVRPHFLENFLVWFLCGGIFLLYSLQQLYHPDFLGFISYGCGDGGNHVSLKNQLLREGINPTPVFVGLYGFVGWLETVFGMRSFESFRLAYYFVLVFALVSCALIGAQISGHETHLWPKRPISKLAYKLALSGGYLLSGLAFLEFFSLPVFHYYQADGFFSQIFGLVPLFLSLLVIAFCGSGYLRIGLLFIIIAITRFTYGLNLSELMLSTAAICFLESRAAQRKWKAVSLVFLGLLLVLLALFALYRLTSVYDMHGEIQPMTVSFHAIFLVLWGGMALLWLFFSRAEEGSRLTYSTDDSACPIKGGFCCGRQRFAFRNLLVYCACYALLSVLSLASLYLWSDIGLTYYGKKYLFSALMLTSLLSPVFLRRFVEESLLKILGVLKEGEKKILLCATSLIFSVLLLVSGGIYLLHRSIAAPLVTYNERKSRLPRYKYIRMLSDLEAERIIEKVITERKMKFGGIVVAHWPSYHFMNQSLGLNSSIELYASDMVLAKPGYCVFWHDTARIRDLKRIGVPAAARAFEKLRSAPGVESIPYKTRIGRERDLQLFFRCYKEDSSTNIPLDNEHRPS